MHEFHCHENDHRRTRESIDARRAVIVHGPPGIGKTTLARRAAEGASDAAGGGVIRLVSALPGARPGAAFLGLVTADDLDAGPEIAAERVRRALLARFEHPFLLIDDAHHLGDPSQRIIEHLLRFESSIGVVLTARAMSGRVPRLRRLVQDGVLDSVELTELKDAEFARFVRHVLAPHRVDPELVEEIREQVGGTPLAMISYVGAALRTGAIRLQRDSYVRSGGGLPRGALDDLVEALLVGATPDAIRVAELIAATGSLAERRVIELSSVTAVDELRRTGLIRVVVSETGTRLEYAQEAIGRAIRDRLDVRRLEAAFAELSAASTDPVSPGSAEAGHELERFVRLALELRIALDVAFLDRAWTWARRHGLLDLAIDVLSTLLDRADRTPDERATWFAARCVTWIEIGSVETARADLASLEHLRATERLGSAACVEVALARAAFAQFGDGDDGVARLVLLVESRARIDAGDQAAATRVEVQRLAFGMYAGRADDLDALEELERSPAGAAAPEELLPAIVPALLVLAHRGDEDALRARVASARELAARHRTRFPELSARLLVVSSTADLVVGAVARAERAFLEETTMHVNPEHDLAPLDATLRQGRAAALDLARGRWVDAIDRLESAVARREVRDPYGVLGGLLARLALALAATGRPDDALSAARQARERRTGVSLWSAASDDLALLAAEGWCGVDVDEALDDLAERSRGAGLHLVELRALHLRACLAPRIHSGLRDRVAEIDARLGLPLTGAMRVHVDELTAGGARHGGPGARLLARLGVHLPTTVGVGVLTPREREVVGLAVLGFPSSAIAERLRTSKRTIDAHLGHVYVKLGVTGRDELSALVERDDFHGIVGG